MPLAFLGFALFFAETSLAQNTKGDKAPAANPRGPFFRLPKIISRSKGGDRANTRDISGRRRIRTKNESSANRVIYQAPNPYRDRKKKGRGDRPAQARGPIFNRPPGQGQRAWRGTRDGSPLRIRSSSAQRARYNVYPQVGPYVNNKSSLRKKSKVYTRTARGRPIYKSKLNRERASRATGGYATASRPFITRGRKNVYWGKVSKGERPITKDLTGRPLRNRNFHSAGIGVGTTDTLKLVGRRPGRDRASSAKVSGGFVSASKRSERPWLGDVSGQGIRRRPPRRHERAGLLFQQPVYYFLNKGERAGARLHGSGYKSAKKNIGNSPVPPRAPGIGANGIGKYRGRFRIGELTPGFSRAGADFRGSAKGRRPPKGGGSVSGKLWNNGRQPIPVRSGGSGFNRAARYQGTFRRGELSPGFGRQGFGYSGDIKSRRPPKGGGSVSGKIWNNDRQAIAVRPGSSGFNRATRFRGNVRPWELNPGFGRQGFGYSGNIKARRPLKGGGSVSGKVFNNEGQSLTIMVPSSSQAKAGQFSGKGKAKKPKHGGGSISGTVFNNEGQSLAPLFPSPSQAKADQYTGKTRVPRLKRIYVQNPKAFEESLKKKKPNPNTYLVNGLQVKRKPEKTKKSPASAQGALPVVRPKSGTVKAAEYAHAMKMYWSYKRSPNSNEAALKGIKPPRTLGRVVAFSGHSRLSKNYRHNPSSSIDALKVLVPGKAYARVNDFQGNTKMKKYNDRRLHPDAQFAHGSRDNVKEDRTILMNLKLFWAKLFKKNDTQPEIVKAKEHKPRYDRKEKELWKALYD
jgi:hypothetical protein